MSRSVLRACLVGLVLAAAGVAAADKALDATRCVLATFEGTPDEAAFVAEASSRLRIAVDDIDVVGKRTRYIMACFEGSNGVNATDSLFEMTPVLRFSFFDMTDVARANNTNELPRRIIAGNLRLPGVRWSELLDNETLKNDVVDECREGLSKEAGVKKEDTSCDPRAGSLILNYVLFTTKDGDAATQLEINVKIQMETVFVPNFQPVIDIYNNAFPSDQVTVTEIASTITATGPVTTVAPTPAPTPEPAPSSTQLCDNALATLVKAEVVEACLPSAIDGVLCTVDEGAFVNEPERRPSTAAGASCKQVADFLTAQGFRTCLTADQEDDVAAILTRCANFVDGAERVAAGAAAALALALAAAALF